MSSKKAASSSSVSRSFRSSARKSRKPDTSPCAARVMEVNRRPESGILGMLKSIQIDPRTSPTMTRIVAKSEKIATRPIKIKIVPTHPRKLTSFPEGPWPEVWKGFRSLIIHPQYRHHPCPVSVHVVILQHFASRPHGAAPVNTELFCHSKLQLWRMVPPNPSDLSLWHCQVVQGSWGNHLEGD
jgi:hypothetical protein